MRTKLSPVLALLVLTSCAAPPRDSLSLAAPAVRPNNVTIGAGGYATLLSAPPSAPAPRTARASDPSQEYERLRNPDDAASRAAEILHRRLTAAEPTNYIGRRIVRDPAPRFAFQFRRNASATLARYSRDPRFTARDGGVPAAELQPTFDEWFPRLTAHRLVGGGSVQEFDGVVAFDMTVDEAAFRAIAAEQGWTIPDQVQLSFGSPANPQSVNPALAPLMRIFARSDRLPGAVNQAALSGRIILRDGCFRLAEHGEGGEPLVLFDRDAELVFDGENYIALHDGPHSITRIGERIMWAGPRGISEVDAGVKALRERCGTGPVISIGAPSSAAAFPLAG